jgi:VWFA-related protein
MRKGFRAGAVVLISGLFLAGFRSSPASQEVQQPKLQYDVRVALKLIQLSVLDKSGNPVTDLAKEDFELTDNGKAVAFDQFEKKIFGAQPDSAAPAYGPGVNRRFFLVFDFSLTRPRGMVKAREMALRFLEEVLQPSDEVAMVSYSVSLGMRVHEYLTTDSARIRKSIQSLQPGAMLGRAENLAQYWVTQAERDSAHLASGKGGQMLEDYEYAAQYGDTSVFNKDKKTDILNQAVQFSQQLRTLAKSLRYVPGTKNIILFSDGIPRPLLYGKRNREASTMSEWGDSADALSHAMASYDSSQIPRRDLLEAFKGMLEEFKSANCPLYAIDTSQVGAGADIEDQEGSYAGGSDISGSSTLREMSNSTGGRYLGNTSNPDKAFQTVRNLMGAIYVLGYPVKDTWDGKYHKVKVKVLRKGCEVVAQAGYYNPKPYSEYSTDDRLFQLMDLALSDNPQFLSPGGNLPFAAFPVWDQGWSYAAGIARIPAEKSAEILGKNAETFLLILNEKNDLQSIVTFNFGEKTPAKGALDARFVMPMKPGRYNLRLVARNRLSGWGARGNSTLIIPDASAAVAWIDPPLLLLPASDIVMAEATPTMTLAGLYPYDAAAYAPALGAIPAGTAKLWAVLRCSGGLAGADLTVSAALSTTADRPAIEVPVALLKQERNGVTKTLFIEFPCSGLAPAAYTLTFTVKESGGFLSGASAVAFRIE